MRKNKFLGMFVIVSIFSNIFVGNIFAGGLNTSWENEGKVQSVLLDTLHEDSTSITKESRGSLLSTGIARITNAGGGKIGILLQALMQVPVDKCYIMANLDKWDEEIEDWVQVESRTFEFSAGLNPDQELTVAIASFNFEGQPTEQYYRLRGVFSAKLGKNTELFSATTDGVLITDQP